jgi:hypothetical protein
MTGLYDAIYPIPQPERPAARNIRGRSRLRPRARARNRPLPRPAPPSGRNGPRLGEPGVRDSGWRVHRCASWQDPAKASTLTALSSGDDTHRPIVRRQSQLGAGRRSRRSRAGRQLRAGADLIPVRRSDAEEVPNEIIPLLAPEIRVTSHLIMVPVRHEEQIEVAVRRDQGLHERVHQQRIRVLVQLAEHHQQFSFQVTGQAHVVVGAIIVFIHRVALIAFGPPWNDEARTGIGHP